MNYYLLNYVADLLTVSYKKTARHNASVYDHHLSSCELQVLNENKNARPRKVVSFFVRLFDLLKIIIDSHSARK